MSRAAPDANRGDRGARWWAHPFTPAAKAALERAFREALRLNDKHIGTEHVLFGVVAMDRDVDAALEAHGVTYGDLLARIDGGV